MEGTGIRIAAVTDNLKSLPGRPVIDNTGLTGTFDIHVKFARNGLAFDGIPDQPGQAVTDLSALPGIFTVIRSLGLDIRSRPPDYRSGDPGVALKRIIPAGNPR
jgi:uncharacterized protein (TIGR03435 family)